MASSCTRPAREFLLDAQLPVRLCDFLNRCEHDALHVSALPNGNRSSDASIAELVELRPDLLVIHQRR